MQLKIQALGVEEIINKKAVKSMALVRTERKVEMER